jgi:hypothetical protein
MAVTANAQDFGYPVEGEPWYYIKAEKISDPALNSGIWKLDRVEINGQNVRDFLIFQEKKEIFNKKVNGDNPFAIKMRYSWVKDKTYDISINFSQIESDKQHVVNITKTSPPRNGYWNSKWKNYLSLVIAEEHGIARNRFPVHATVGILSRYIHSPNEIRVVRADKKGKDCTYQEIPCQVYDVHSWKDTDLLTKKETDEKTNQPITRYHQTTTLSFAFLIDIKPREKATYLVFYNNPDAEKPKYISDLKIIGNGLDKTIDNSFFKVSLDKKSGMIFKIFEKSSRLLLEHKLETNGAVHWNPGAYSPPHAWVHCSDWDNPPYTETEGPVFYSLKRSAPLPHLKDIHVSINYYFYDQSPIIIMESTMLIKKDLAVKALRNGEIVFNKEIFNRLAFQTIKGKTHTIDLSNTKMHPEHVITLRPDTPWISLLNKDKGIAFANLFLDSATANILGGPASLQQPYIYVQNGPWYYIARAFVYSFGSNNQSRMLPVKNGSLYYEKNAWVPFPFKKMKELSRSLDKYYEMYKYPLNIHEVIETYLESPEGWLVPILTEPFDEGVEEAIGGKIKKILK